MASPLEEDKIRFTNLICLGGPKFNAATDYYLRTGKPYFTMTKESGHWEVKIVRGSRTGEVLPSSDKDDIGMILKLRDVEHNNATVFIAAGLGVNGTRAAAEYLFGNWSKLHHQYGDGEFGISLKCTHYRVPEVGPDGYKHPELLCQLPS